MVVLDERNHEATYCEERERNTSTSEGLDTLFEFCTKFEVWVLEYFVS